jgi:hypothetical protein
MQITVVNFAVCLISVKELAKIVKWINDFYFGVGTNKAFKRLNYSKTLQKEFTVFKVRELLRKLVRLNSNL